MSKTKPAPHGRKPWQRYLAEAIGTFAVVFGACGVVISDVFSGGAVTLLGIAFVPGLTVLAMIYTLGPVSAAHFNPAVTLAFALTKRFPWRHVPRYLLAQLIGALAASLSHAFLYGQETALKANYGAHLPAAGVSWAQAFGFELIFGFLLMFVIAGVATDKRVGGAIPGLAIGMTVALAIMMGGPLSGASMNPVRSLAPALFAGGAALQALPIYLIAPTLGAIGAVYLYDLLRDGPDHAQSAPADFL
jgi:MIP family channel proteins